MAAQARRNRHAAKAAHLSRDDADHGLVAAQVDNRGVDLGNRCQTQICLLQPHAAGFEQDHGARWHAVAVVFGGQFQRTGYLGAAHFTEAAALECAFDGHEHYGEPIDGALGDDDAIVALRHHALACQPWRRQAVERPGQFAERAGVEQGLRAGTRAEFDKALA